MRSAKKKTSQEYLGCTLAPEERTFLEKIASAPHGDDAPRLAYADWLVHNGDPRGEFIHVQCQLAETADDDEDAWLRLPKEEQRLLSKHKRKWLGYLADVAEDAIFSRGFLDKVKLTEAAFLANVELLFGILPLRRVHLTEFACTAQFQRCSGLTNLTELDLSENFLSTDEIAPLGRMPQLTGLRVLDLTRDIGALDEGNFLDDAAASCIADSESFHKLETLQLKGNGIGPVGMIAVAGSQKLRKLKEIDFGNHGDTEWDGYNQIDIDGAIAIAVSEVFQNLHSLGLEYTGLDDDMLLVLAGAPYFGSLERFEIAGNPIGGRGAVALLQSAWCRNTGALRLNRNPIGNDGLADIVNCPALQKIRVLELTDCRIGDAGVGELVSSPFVNQLEELIIQNIFDHDQEKEFESITDTGAVMLAKCRCLDNLECLSLYGQTGISERGHKILRGRFADRLFVDQHITTG